MASNRSFLTRITDRVAGSTERIVGAVGALAGAAHLAGWTLTTNASWPDALAAGEVGSVAAELAAYATTHPAYAVLVLAGVAVAARAE